MPQTLSKAALAYVACALGTSYDDEERPLDENYSADDIDGDALSAMVAEVETFLSDHDIDIDGELEHAAHDFWLTRNRHGSGFWDGDWPAAVGERLTVAAHKAGERNLYVGDDGRIYQYPN
jgi:hypothetical protein